MIKRYLFFLRHYNDIDNIAPVIYYFLKESENHRADVIIYDDYDFRNDNNLIFLKDNYGDRFTFKWIGSYYGFKPDYYFEKSNDDSLIKSFKDTFLKPLVFANRRLNHLTGVYFSDIIKAVLRIKGSLIKNNNNIADSRVLGVSDIRTGKGININSLNLIIKDILEEHTWPSLVIFDIVRTNTVRGLLNSLRYNGIQRIICLPVSPLININTLREESFVDLYSNSFKRKHDYSGFDALGYVDNYFVDSFNKTHSLLGVESTLKGKTKALGSIRYCPDWLSIREKFTTTFDYNTDKIKVVFFPSQPKSNVNWDEVERILLLFSLYKDYQVIVKNHPRHTQSNRIFKTNPFTNIKYIKDVDSSSLINWADVVLFWSTSVAIEGYIKNKTMVCLSYVVGNTNLYEMFDAGFVARCRDDLHEFLELYKKDKSSIRYNKRGIDKLINTVLIPGGDKVINNYIEFMKENEMDLYL